MGSQDFAVGLLSVFFWSQWSAKSEVLAFGEPLVLLVERRISVLSLALWLVLLWEQWYWQALY